MVFSPDLLISLSSKASLTNWLYQISFPDEQHEYTIPPALFSKNQHVN